MRKKKEDEEHADDVSKRRSITKTDPNTLVEEVAGMLSDGDSPIIMAIFSLIDDLRDWCSSGVQRIRTTYDACLELITAPDKGFHGS